MSIDRSNLEEVADGALRTFFASLCAVPFLLLFEQTAVSLISACFFSAIGFAVWPLTEEIRPAWLTSLALTSGVLLAVFYLLLVPIVLTALAIYVVLAFYISSWFWIDLVGATTDGTVEYVLELFRWTWSFENNLITGVLTALLAGALFVGWPFIALFPVLAVNFGAAVLVSILAERSGR